MRSALPLGLVAMVGLSLPFMPFLPWFICVKLIDRRSHFVGYGLLTTTYITFRPRPKAYDKKVYIMITEKLR